MVGKGGDRACCPSPRIPPPLSAFGLDFRPFGLAPMKNPGQAQLIDRVPAQSSLAYIL